MIFFASLCCLLFSVCCFDAFIASDMGVSSSGTYIHAYTYLYISRWPFNDVIYLATFVTITEKAEMPQRLCPFSS